ncbi:MAG: preprotein translocase subunit SecG [Planctomycetota bacterium]
MIHTIIHWFVEGIEFVALGSAILMVFMILLQEPKSGGLALLGGTGLDQSLGVSNPLRRATVYLAIVFMVGSLILAIYQGQVRADAMKHDKLSALEGSNDTGKPGADHYTVRVVNPGKNPTEVLKQIGLITGLKDPKALTEQLAKHDIVEGVDKDKADQDQTLLEAAGAQVELVPTAAPAGAKSTTPPTGKAETKSTPPAFLPTSTPAQEEYTVFLDAVGPHLDQVKKVVGELCGETDSAKIDKIIASKVIQTQPHAAAEAMEKKLEAAGATVTLKKNTGATPPAPASKPEHATAPTSKPAEKTTQPVNPPAAPPAH